MRAGDRGVRAPARRSRRRPGAHRRRGPSPHDSTADDLDAWIDAPLRRGGARSCRRWCSVPTDTPPGNNAPHAERTGDAARRLRLRRRTLSGARRDAYASYGLDIDRPTWSCAAATADGPTIALNAHGDVVPPGEGWTHDPVRRRGRRRQALRPRRRRSARATSRPTPSPCARLESLRLPISHGGGRAALHLRRGVRRRARPRLAARSMGLIKPDLLIAAGFSYQVVTAHNGCLQLEVDGARQDGARRDSGDRRRRAAGRGRDPERALCAERRSTAASRRRSRASPTRTSTSARIEGGTNTNVVPGKVVLKLDRRMIPEEDPVEVEATTAPGASPKPRRAGPASRSRSRRLLLASVRCTPLPGNAALVAALQRHGEAVFGEADPGLGHAALHRRAPVRRGRHPGGDLRRRPAHGARVECQARRRAPELEDLRRAIKVVARTLYELPRRRRRAAE